MGINDLEAADIERALEAYRKLGREEFLWKLNMGRPLRYMLEFRGALYPAAAITAWASGASGIGRDDVHAVRRLTGLGYQVTETPQPVNPLMDSGNSIDARIEVEPVFDGLAITICSAGGGSNGNRARNPEYRVALSLVLEQMAASGASLTRALVDSEVAFKVEPSLRYVQLRAPFTVPIDLGRNVDLHDLGNALCTGQNTAGRRESGGRPSGGNSRKRLRLTFDIAEESAKNDLLTGSQNGAPGGRKPDDSRRGPDRDFEEGHPTEIRLTKFERNRDARAACISANDPVCKVCGFDFERRYGELGKGFIHVHHVVPLSATRRRYKVDPIRELVPVCPNCHAMLHKEMPSGFSRSIEELRRLLNEADEK